MESSCCTWELTQLRSIALNIYGILLMTSLSSSLHGYAVSDVDRMPGHNVLKQIAIDPYTQHKLPVLKMFKRQIKNFRTGRKHEEATLTLVFTANEPVDAQWFEVASVDNKEVMYPILPGHPSYSISALHSGDVTATTIVIPVRHHGNDHVFETILTNINGTMQYQLKTTLKKKIVYRLDDIDSPEWLVVPPHQSHLSLTQKFQRHCRSFTRLEPGGNALILMHAQPVQSKTTDGQLTQARPEFRKIVQTHDSGQENHNEEQGTMILEGRMHLISYKSKRDAGVFDVKAKQPKAKLEREGVYLCSVERYSLDKLNILSFVSIGRHHNLSHLFSSKATIELATCATTNYNIATNLVVWSENSIGCLRCRSHGYPKPVVEIKKKYKNRSESLLTNGNIGVTMFTNVAEAGVVEAIYLFQHVNKNTAGSYVCESYNTNGGGSIFFDIKVRSKRY